MENAYFLISDDNLKIERFHLCTWEFNNSSSLLEIGCEIASESLPNEKEEIRVDLYIPWLNGASSLVDLYTRLCDSKNAKFIFNDSVIGTKPLDDVRNLLGVIHHFEQRPPLCILPASVATLNKEGNKLEVTLSLNNYNANKIKDLNLYFRFLLSPPIQAVSTRKKGIGRSTIIYDVKVNERRNLPDSLINEVKKKFLCEIKSCFCFHIVPNSYDLSFFDSSSLVNVRTLEYESFNYYLQDRRVKKDELMVVFNKKKKPDSFAFFSIFVKERIGTGQFILAILINLLCGILLFLPGFRKEYNTQLFSKIFWKNLPLEVYLAISIIFLLLAYFLWPSIIAVYQKLRSGIKKIVKGK
jgi:hypothetical protein